VEAVEDVYPASVWEALAGFLSRSPDLVLAGGARQAALSLQRHSGLPLSLRSLALAELQHVVRLAVGPDRRLLAYDAWHGGRMQVGKAVQGKANTHHAKAPAADVKAATDFKPKKDVAPAATKPRLPPTPTRADTDGCTVATLRLAEALRAGPLPQTLSDCGDADLRWRQEALRACVESLYRDRLEPTLFEVQRRLCDDCGWRIAEAQAAPLLAARAPQLFMVAAPGAMGEPVRLQLVKTPSWFQGWVGGAAAGVQEDPYPEKLWTALAEFLAKDESMVLQGGIDGAALALRHFALPQLHHLSLGELRDVVRRAVAERGLLTYTGHDLRPVPRGLAPSGNGHGEGVAPVELRIFSRI